MSEKTLTLDLPDDLADQFSALPAESRNQFAIVLLRAGLIKQKLPETGQAVAERQAKLFAQWTSEPEDAEPSVEEFMDAMNASRLLNGERPVY
ncbi:MAG: hypothetical protein OHK0029_39510 [Armatimonadaceae bacterium]